MKLKAILITAAIALVGLTGMAQDEIQFGVGKSTDKKMSKEVKELLTGKVSQILNRNSAAAGGEFGAFVVTPTLTLTDASATSGLARNFTVITGELTLTAKNRDDKSEYYSVTVPLKATDKTGTADPMQTLAKSIKPTDAAYVRFIRTARENISKSFEKDCEETMARAKAIYATGNLENAMSLLMAIPASSSCNDEVMELLQGMGALKAQKAKEKKEKAELRIGPKGGKINPDEKVAKDKPTTGASTSESDNENDGDNTDAEEENGEGGSETRFFISDPDWELKADSFKWVETNRNIVCDIRIRNISKSVNRQYVSAGGAISCDGDQYREIDTKNNINDFPENVWIKLQFFIKDIKTNPGCLARFTFTVGNSIKCEINDIKVE